MGYSETPCNVSEFYISISIISAIGLFPGLNFHFIQIGGVLRMNIVVEGTIDLIIDSLELGNNSISTVTRMGHDPNIKQI